MRYFAWALGVLGLLLVIPAAVEAQVESGRVVQLEQNSPNPFNLETTIPFTLIPELWEIDKPVVSLRI